MQDRSCSNFSFSRRLRDSTARFLSEYTLIGLPARAASAAARAFSAAAAFVFASIAKLAAAACSCAVVFDAAGLKKSRMSAPFSWGSGAFRLGMPTVTGQ